MAINYRTVQLGQKNDPQHFNDISADATNVLDNIHPQYVNSLLSQHFGGAVHFIPFNGATDRVLRAFHDVANVRGPYQVSLALVGGVISLDLIRKNLHSLINSTGQSVPAGKLIFTLESGGAGSGTYTISLSERRYDSSNVNTFSNQIATGIADGRHVYDISFPQAPEYEYAEYVLEITPAGSGLSGEKWFCSRDFHLRFTP